MHITVLTFGIATDITNSRTISVELDTPATVATLKQKLIELYPRLGTLKSLAIAVNGAYATNDTLNESDEVAIIPPVSGG